MPALGDAFAFIFANGSSLSSLELSTTFFAAAAVLVDLGGTRRAPRGADDDEDESVSSPDAISRYDAARDCGVVCVF